MLVFPENYFELFELEEDASEREVKIAYTALLRQYPIEYYPKEFKIINQAYQTLLDVEKRQAYKRSLTSDEQYDRLLVMLERNLYSGHYKEAIDIIDELENAGYEQDKQFLKLAFITFHNSQKPHRRTIMKSRLIQQYEFDEDVVELLLEFYEQQEPQQYIALRKKLYERYPQDHLHIMNYVQTMSNAQALAFFRSIIPTVELCDPNMLLLDHALYVGIHANDRAFVNLVIEKMHQLMHNSPNKEQLLLSFVSNLQIGFKDISSKAFTDVVAELNTTNSTAINNWVEEMYDNFFPTIPYYEINDRQMRPISSKSCEQEPASSISDQAALEMQSFYAVTEGKHWTKSAFIAVLFLLILLLGIIRNFL